MRLASVGNSALLTKTDGEPAIIALREAVTSLRDGETIPESLAKGESQSNGKVERAVRTLRARMRTMKYYIQDKANMKIGSDQPIL